MKFNYKSQNKQKYEAFVSHFRMLGLNRGECRTNVIRSAAQSKAAALSQSSDHHLDDEVQQAAHDDHRARIAIAAYRLLDPRERSDLYERVQLCYPIDRDDQDATSIPPGKLIEVMVREPAKAPCSAGAKVKLMGQPLIDEAIEGNLPADEEPDAAVAINASKSSSELSLEEKRSIVRLLRSTDESNPRILSPLGWLRHRLGI